MKFKGRRGNLPLGSSLNEDTIVADTLHAGDSMVSFNLQMNLRPHYVRLILAPFDGPYPVYHLDGETMNEANEQIEMIKARYRSFGKRTIHVQPLTEEEYLAETAQRRDLDCLNVDE